MERQYIYEALTPWRSIRLLRLAPSMDASEALQGQLFEYALEDVYDQAFPYEALSYVWGDPKTRHAIAIDGSDIPITANLHDALKRLRDKRHERLLWVDALCIDQRNDQEKEHQIQLMYQIYACASCVVVWLGEEIDESDQALEDLRMIGRQDKKFEDLQSLDVYGSTASEKNDRIIERIGKLFQRAWFRRIWVLQEVGAARRVQIRCGNAALDGYAFALAASLLQESFRVRGASQALQRTIQSTTHLIKRSIFRPTYQAAEAPSERVGSFGELVNMFHDREATVAHDKIYALLGMTSDDMGKSGLLPDYAIARGQLFQRMVEFVVSDKISIECQNDKEVAVIKARCYILGHISKISDDSVSGITQTVSVQWNDEVTWHDKAGEDAPMMIQTPATPLQQDDILCLLDGAKALTIIRLHQDFSVIVSAATTPRDMDWPTRFASLDQSELPAHDLVLIWDWNYHPDSYCSWGDYESWTESNDWVPEGPNLVAVHRPDVLSRQCELALICLDMFGADHARARFEGVLSSLDVMLRADDLHMAARRILSSLVSGVAKLSHDASDSKRSGMALLKDKEATDHVPRLLRWAMEKRYEILPGMIVESGFLDFNLNGSTSMAISAAYGRLDVVDLLLREGVEVNRLVTFSPTKAEVNDFIFKASMETTALERAAGAGQLLIVERLLQEKAEVNIPSERKRAGRTALQAAAEGGHVSVVERLLQENADVHAPPNRFYGLTALQAAAGAGCMVVVERLIREKADVNAPPCGWGGLTALQKASEAGHISVVERLLQEKADVNAPAGDGGGKTALQAASEGGHLLVVERLLQENADVNAPPSQSFGVRALTAAADGGHLAVLERLLEAEAEVNKRESAGTPLEHALRNGHLAIVERLKEAGAI